MTFPLQLLQQSGFRINQGLSLAIERADENDVRRALANAQQERWQLAIIVLNSRNSDEIYNLVKSYSNGQLGLMTQCVNYQALKRNIRKLDMCKYTFMVRRIEMCLVDVENISQKINGKLGGINGVVNIKSALSRTSREDLFMFFGADVRMQRNRKPYEAIWIHLGHSFDLLEWSSINRSGCWFSRSDQ